MRGKTEMDKSQQPSERNILIMDTYEAEINIMETYISKLVRTTKL
jgi:uncharacterized membrane protein